MKRDLMTYLKKWVHEPRRKPILMKGARQVGKSWLGRELGKEFEHFVEINFEKLPDLCAFFQGNLDVRIITKNIANYFTATITPGKTLLFLDEIQVCPRAILALRYFYEDFPELHVIAAGSLLEFELGKISVPVGRISFLYVYPMTFAEYLTAAGKENLRHMILENNFNPIPEPLHKLLENEIKNYTLTGGLPEVVDDFIQFQDLARCTDIQAGLIETYTSDFHKYARKHQVKYLQRVFESVPQQLGDKFKYANVSREIKSRELGEALDLLEMAGLIYKVYHTNANGIPLKAESNIRKFKVLFFDAGLAQRLLKLDHRPLLLNPDITLINNGAVAELLAGLEFIGHQGPLERAELFYWHRESKSSNAEIDYVINLGGEIVPVEVKSGSTGSMKSLKLFMTGKSSRLGIKLSGYNFSRHENVQSVPFYGIEALSRTAIPNH